MEESEGSGRDDTANSLEMVSGGVNVQEHPLCRHCRGLHFNLARASTPTNAPIQNLLNRPFILESGPQLRTVSQEHQKIHVHDDTGHFRPGVNLLLDEANGTWYPDTAFDGPLPSTEQLRTR